VRLVNLNVQPTGIGPNTVGTNGSVGNDCHALPRKGTVGSPWSMEGGKYAYNTMTAGASTRPLLSSTWAVYD